MMALLHDFQKKTKKEKKIDKILSRRKLIHDLSDLSEVNTIIIHLQPTNTSSYPFTCTCTSYSIIRVM